MGLALRVGGMFFGRIQVAMEPAGSRNVDLVSVAKVGGESLRYKLGWVICSLVG